jgi:DNA-binding transcriptional LysR family regulator
LARNPIESCLFSCLLRRSGVGNAANRARTRSRINAYALYVLGGHLGVVIMPSPMCQPPRRFGSDWLAPEELPPEATGNQEAIWLRKDAPLLLHAFAHITRGPLKNWSRSLH